MFLLMSRLWKALKNAPSNTFLSRRFLSAIQVANFCLPGEAPRWLGGRFWLPCADGSPMFVAFPGPGLPSMEKITFLSVPSDHKTERLGNDGKRLAFVTKEDLSESAFQNPAAKILLL